MFRRRLVAVCFSVAVASGCGANPQSNPGHRVPGSGEIAFGADLDSTGHGVTGEVTCLNPGLGFYEVAHLAHAAEGGAEVRVAGSDGSATSVKTHYLVGGIDRFSDYFAPFALKGPARYQWTVVLDDGSVLATGSLNVDSWPPDGCPGLGDE